VSLQLRVASAGVVSQVRWLNLHEFHSKKMMKDGNITVQRFRMAESAEDAEQISKTFSTSTVSVHFIIIVIVTDVNCNASLSTSSFDLLCVIFKSIITVQYKRAKIVKIREYGKNKLSLLLVLNFVPGKPPTV